MIPQYTEAPAYKLIKSFCRMIGVEICYGTVPPNTFAVAEVDDCPPRIRISVNKNYAFAPRVLGHELGHHLVECLYRGELENADYLIIAVRPNWKCTLSACKPYYRRSRCKWYRRAFPC